MPWVKLDDQFPDHPKVVEVGALGLALQVAALCWCARGLTDGHLPRRAARKLIDTDEYGIPLDTVIDELVTAGLWHTPGHTCPSCPNPSAGSYYVHDYLELQPSREQHERDVEQRRAAGRKGGQAKARRAAKRPASDPPTEPASETSDSPSSGTAGGMPSGTPSPIPSPHPDPKTRTRSSSPPNPPAARRPSLHAVRDDDEDPADAINPGTTLRTHLAGPPAGDAITWTLTALRNLTDHTDPTGQAATLLAEHVAEHTNTPVGPRGIRSIRQLLDRHPLRDVLHALDDAATRPDVANPLGYARTTLTNARTTA